MRFDLERTKTELEEEREEAALGIERLLDDARKGNTGIACPSRRLQSAGTPTRTASSSAWRTRGGG